MLQADELHIEHTASVCDPCGLRVVHQWEGRAWTVHCNAQLINSPWLLFLLTPCRFWQGQCPAAFGVVPWVIQQW